MRIFFVSDIHGSETCFRKLVNAGRFYGVDVLLMGGDLSGKVLVPIVRVDRGWTARFRGSAFALKTVEEVAEFERRVASVGGYTCEADDELLHRLSTDEGFAEETLKRLIRERTEEWVALAAERLDGTGIRLLIGLGNDDWEDLAACLNLGPVGYADGVLQLGEFTLVSLGWSNITPWHTQRECTEEELAEKLGVVAQAKDPGRTIFNIHVPPYDCGLDLVPRLDDSLQVQLVGGQPDMVPVGSTAVAAAIASCQPLLSLHGHVHQGRGQTRIGRTVVVNPGSEYDDAALLGALIEVEPNNVKQCQLVAG